MTSTPSDSNVVNPKTFTITPGPVVDGAPVDDFTILFGISDANNAAPTSFTPVRVPAKDLTPNLSGDIVVPLPDIFTTRLVPGTYAVKAEADSGVLVSGDTALVFFNIVQAPPSTPAAFTVA